MALLYKEEIIPGEVQKYRRSFCFSGQNPLLPGMPTITFSEQDVWFLSDGEVFTKDNVGFVTASIENPAEVVTLYNPVNNSEVGSITKQSIFVALYSLYLHEIQKRDAKQQ